jgi:hypothetical protein
MEVKFIYSEQAFVSGSWDGWKHKEQMQLDNDNNWSLLKTLPQGKYEYKFIVNENYINDPSNSFKSIEPPYNNLLVVPSERITITYHSGEQHTEVKLCGNPWTEQLPMKRNNDQWEINLLLPHGKFEYKFICDGQWKTDITALYNEDDTRNNYEVVIPRVNQELDKIQQRNDVHPEQVPEQISNIQVNSSPNKPNSPEQVSSESAQSEKVNEQTIDNTTNNLPQVKQQPPRVDEPPQKESISIVKQQPPRVKEPPHRVKESSSPIGISVSPTVHISTVIYEQFLKYLQDEVKELEIMEKNQGVPVIVSLAIGPRVSQYLPPRDNLESIIPIILQRNNNFNSVVDNLVTNLKNLVVVQFCGDANLQFKFMPGQREKLIALIHQPNGN